MPDPYRKVQAGENIVLSATVHNAMLDLLKQTRTGGGAFEVPVQSGIVNVWNDTGSDLDQFSVVGLDSTIFLPSESTDAESAFLQAPAFLGVTPTWEYRGRFGVYLEPVPVDAVGKACVAGVCIARVDVADHEHCWADIDNNELGFLVSGGEGGAQILWREGEEPYGSSYEGYGYTGAQWAIVRIGPMSTQRWAKLPSGGIAAAATGTVEFYSDGTMVSLTGETAPATNYWPDDATPASRKCTVKRSGTIWTVDSWACS